MAPSGRYDERREGKRRYYDGYDSYQEEYDNRVSRRSPSNRYDESKENTRRSYESYKDYRDNHYDRTSRRPSDDASYKRGGIKREHAEDDGYFNLDNSAYEGRSEFNFGHQRSSLSRHVNRRDGAY